MNLLTEQDDYIKGFVKEAVANENILQPNIEITGTSEVGDGYTSIIYFTKVTGKLNNSETKTLEVILKRATRNPVLRKQLQLNSAFLQEIKFYNEVLPIFEKFQSEKSVHNPLPVPKCYKTFVTENEEILVLENLKAKNFCMHNIKNPMCIQEIKLVLEGYSHIHALSFAIRYQNLNKFKEITENYNFCRKTIFGSDHVLQLFQNGKKEWIDILKKYEKWSLLEKLEKNDFRNMLNSDDPSDKHSVIFHGDCWNNNFMFQYLNSDKTAATKVAILDWQVSSLGSPILDIAYYILGNWTKTLDVNSLLDYYYDNVTSYISKFGCNPEEIYPRKVFNGHWRKYGKMGLVFLTISMKLRYKEDMPDISKALENDVIVMVRLLVLILKIGVLIIKKLLIFYNVWRIWNYCNCV